MLALICLPIVLISLSNNMEICILLAKPCFLQTGLIHSTVILHLWIPHLNHDSKVLYHFHWYLQHLSIIFFSFEQGIWTAIWFRVLPYNFLGNSMALFFFLYFGHKAVGSRFHIQKEPPDSREQNLSFPIISTWLFYSDMKWNVQNLKLWSSHIFQLYLYYRSMRINSCQGYSVSRLFEYFLYPTLNYWVILGSF